MSFRNIKLLKIKHIEQIKGVQTCGHERLSDLTGLDVLTGYILLDC